MRRTKILCTLGPATSSPESIEALMNAGMDCARLNFSHGTHAEHAQTFRMIREASERIKRPIAILQDLQGPKIRVGRISEEFIELVSGRETTITIEDVEGTPDRFQTDYEGLPADVSIGDPILLDDGMISLRVESVTATDVRCRVIVGGILRERKGINLPGSRLTLLTPTEKDLIDLALGCELGVDFVALSFVEGPEDVNRLRARMDTLGAKDTPIIAKIERPLAVENLNDIISVSDGLMIARGDLGVEIPAERVPAIQKMAIELANSHGKLVIIATQMLDSMTRSPRPTRAEVSDVANAVLDGADALMLSGETAIGAYPLETAQTMSTIIAEVEGTSRFRIGIDRSFRQHMPTFQNATARAAVNAAADLGLRTIAAFTNSGLTAALLSEYRPSGGIVAFSPFEKTLRRMAIYWGVCPLPMVPIESTDELFAAVGEDLLARGIADPGEALVIVAGVPPGEGRPTNLVKLHRLEKPTP